KEKRRKNLDSRSSSGWHEKPPDPDRPGRRGPAIMEWFRRSFWHALHDHRTVSAAQAPDVDQRDVDSASPETARHVVEVATRIGHFVVGGRRNDVVLKA